MTNEEIFTEVEQHWRCRYPTRGLTYGTEAYKRAEAEYFTGAMTALKAMNLLDELGPRWFIPMMSNKCVLEET